MIRRPARPRRGRVRGGVLIIVQNLPVPRDRRVWLECQALVGAGYPVSVICPAGDGRPGVEHLDGVDIHRYRTPPPTTGTASFVLEFALCWLRTAALSWRVWRRHRFAVLQACNPPDTYFLLAAIYRAAGVRFVFDQHDLCPELYLSRMDRPLRLVHRAVRALEACTYRLADEVIVTNQSYASRATGRGQVDPARVTVVRNGPDTRRLRPGPSRPELRRGRLHLACWVGVMGPQDGVGGLVDAIDHFVRVLGRTDTSFALLGSGDCLAEVRRKVADLGLEDYVATPGWVEHDEMIEYLSTADVGLGADQWSTFNDVSTMCKTMEYLAFGLPIVCYDLTETRVTAGALAAYVPSGDTAALARALSDLLDDPVRRAAMGEAGLARVRSSLAWDRQVPGYLAVYRRLLGGAAATTDLAALEQLPALRAGGRRAGATTPSLPGRATG